jgi:NDP-sugar pyrophosphorylase family protein
VLPAAGEGRRMRPISLYWPKFLLPVLDRPLIFYSLDDLLEGKVEKIIVYVRDNWALSLAKNLAYDSKDVYFEVSIDKYLNADPITCHSLLQNTNADLLAVFLPDIYVHEKRENSLCGMLRTLEEYDADMVVAIAKAPASAFKEHKRVIVNSNGEVIDVLLDEANKSGFQRTGKFLIRREVVKELLPTLEELRNNKKGLSLTQLYLQLTLFMIKTIVRKGFRIQSYLMEPITNVNTPADLLEVNLQELRNRNLSFYIDRSASVTASNIINSVICKEAKVINSIVQESLVLPNSTLTTRKIVRSIAFGEDQQLCI